MRYVNTSDNNYHKRYIFEDTDGNYIYLQGGCILKVCDKYYWYGVKYKEADIYAKILETVKAGNAITNIYLLFVGRFGKLEV